MFALSDGDASGQGSLVIVDTVIRDLQVVCPAVCEDAATTLRPVRDGKAIDARRVAHEVAGETTIGVATPKKRRTVRERICHERIRRETYAFRQDRNGRTFVGAHQ